MSDPTLPPWRRLDNFGLIAHQRVIERINETTNLTHGGNTEVMSSPSGRGLIDRPQPSPSHIAPVIRIEGFSRTFAGDSAPFALPGGYYWGFVQTGTATTFPAANGGPDFNAATYYTDRDTTPVIVYNLLESGLVASHSLAAGTRLPCDDIREVTDVAANGSNYPVSNGMTFALYRFYGYSLGCL